MFGPPSPGRRLAPWLALAGVLAYASWSLMERLPHLSAGPDREASA